MISQTQQPRNSAAETYLSKGSTDLESARTTTDSSEDEGRFRWAMEALPYC